MTHSPPLSGANPFAIDADESLIAAYEAAFSADRAPLLVDYLPTQPGPNRLATLVELVRTDLERRWDAGSPKDVASYLSEFPELARTPNAVAAVAFEEYRTRLRHGNAPRVEEYQSRYKVATHSWPVAEPSRAGNATVCQPVQAILGPEALANEGGKTLAASIINAVTLGELQAANPKATLEWQESIQRVPEVGAEFEGFHLVEELGRGAFGRVFLARQGDLAGRLVALKVGTSLFPESQALAQLQHTNIVPIYSLHQVRNVQAVCMPYFGRTTLATVLDGLRSQPTLPASGNVLHSTVNLHALSTRQDSRLAGTEAPPDPERLPPTTQPAVWDLIKKMSYPNAVAWLGANLAAGLAHAHGRGILHRDLKPANVLLTDDGVPMLLDFNLAEDTKLRRQLGGAMVGGTLPYMAPEQLSAFIRQGGEPDARSDIYSLGVMMYELVTGRRPFAEEKLGPLQEIVKRMIGARRSAPPSARSVNPAAPWGVDAVIRKCMAPEQRDRYQSATDLQEDLERHLANQPLQYAREPLSRERARKWLARHPRLGSSATVATVAAILLTLVATAGMYARERSRSLEAHTVLQQHRGELRDLQAIMEDRHRSVSKPEEGDDRCAKILSRYGIATDGAERTWEDGALVRYLSDAERDALRGDAGEVFFLMARSALARAAFTTDGVTRAELLRNAEQWNAAAERLAGERLPRALSTQKADLARLRGNAEREKAARKTADETAPGSARDHYLLGAWFAQRGRYRDALPHLRTATLIDPEHLPAWFVRGNAHLALEQPEMAALCFGSCIAVDKTFVPAWLNRGLAYNHLRFFDQACDDYDRALRLDPSLVEALLQRADAKEGLRNLPGAIEDLTKALQSGGAPTRAYFARARLLEETGDREGAAADRAEGMRNVPGDELSWIARAEARMGDDPKAALNDVDEALKLNPASMFGLQLKAHILAERLTRPQEAVAALDRAVTLYPEYAPAVAGRGVLLARVGRRAEAIRDAEEAVLRDGKSPNLYQVGCIYALTAKLDRADKARAFEFLWAALRTGYGLDIVDTDADLDPIRNEPEFKRMVAAAKARQKDL